MKRNWLEEIEPDYESLSSFAASLFSPINQQFQAQICEGYESDETVGETEKTRRSTEYLWGRQKWEEILTIQNQGFIINILIECFEDIIEEFTIETVIRKAKKYQLRRMNGA